MRVHGPMSKLTLYAFLDPRSNKLSTVSANWTKNYPKVDNPGLFPNCVHPDCESTAALHGRYNGSNSPLFLVGKSSFCGMHADLTKLK